MLRGQVQAHVLASFSLLLRYNFNAGEGNVCHIWDKELFHFFFWFRGEWQ